MGAHVRGALQDRLLQRAHGAGVDVLRRESGLGLGGLGNGLVEVALVRLDAIEDAGFVEMNVGLDETRRHQPAAEIDGFAVGRKARFDGGDPPIGDADVGQFMLGADAARVSKNEIHSPSRYGFTLAITPC